MTDENSLWIQILITKYGAAPEDCSQWRPKVNMSNAWKSIIKSVPVLQKGCRKIVRNGRDTLFWMDNWLEKEPLANQALTAINSENRLNPIVSYWTTGSGWNWAELDQLLPESVLDRLVAVFIQEDQEAKDIIGWRAEPSGIFTVNSAYNLAMDHSEPLEAARWNAI